MPLKQMVADAKGRMRRPWTRSCASWGPCGPAARRSRCSTPSAWTTTGPRLPSTRSATSRSPTRRSSLLQPWDPSLLPAIEKAIRTSDLDLNPQNDGKIIRIPVPSLTEERRKNLVKVAHKQAEEGRIAVRNVRRDANDHLKKLLKEHEVSEDDEKHALAEVQKLTDQHIEEINAALKKKEAEIMEV
jgi:ribosome recycling factor